jgi:hypothetical protein
LFYHSIIKEYRERGGKVLYSSRLGKLGGRGDDGIGRETDEKGEGRKLD